MGNTPTQSSSGVVTKRYSSSLLYFPDFGLGVVVKSPYPTAVRSNLLNPVSTCSTAEKLRSLESKTIEISAYAKVLSRKQKPLFTRVIHLICCKKAFSRRFQKEAEKEVSKIEQDRKEISEASQKEIDAIRKQP